jgi:hypothetical protein
MYSLLFQTFAARIVAHSAKFYAIKCRPFLKTARRFTESHRETPGLCQLFTNYLYGKTRSVEAAEQTLSIWTRMEPKRHILATTIEVSNRNLQRRHLSQNRTTGSIFKLFKKLGVSE